MSTQAFNQYVWSGLQDTPENRRKALEGVSAMISDLIALRHHYYKCVSQWELLTDKECIVNPNEAIHDLDTLNKLMYMAFGWERNLKTPTNN